MCGLVLISAEDISHLFDKSATRWYFTPMNNKGVLTHREAMEREKARLLEQAAAIDRDMAELDRIAAKYNLVVSAPSSKPAPAPTAPTAPSTLSVPYAPQIKGEPFDGSLRGLAHCYRTNENSAYQKLRYKTRESYDNQLRRLENDFGTERVEDIDAERILRAHKEWTGAGRHLAMGHSLIGMMRMLATFGSTILKDRACRELRVMLHDMKFPTSKRRTDRSLTADQAHLIRAMAHQMGRPSIALAQALQFGLKLGQKDVIGEWLPLTEPGFSDVISDGKRWFRGLRWEQIDANFFLRRTASEGGRDIEVDLRSSPIVMEELTKELARLGGKRPPSGPVVICEWNDLPWTQYEFRRWWRKVADAAGIPNNVKNMDSFAGSKKGRPRVARTSDGLAHDGPRYPSGEETETGRATEDLLSVARH
jgi:hypothetical protein